MNKSMEKFTPSDLFPGPSIVEITMFSIQLISFCFFSCNINFMYCMNSNYTKSKKVMRMTKRITEFRLFFFLCLGAKVLQLKNLTGYSINLVHLHIIFFDKINTYSMK